MFSCDGTWDQEQPIACQTLQPKLHLLAHQNCARLLTQARAAYENIGMPKHITMADALLKEAGTR